MKLSDRVALITGGAQGLGKSIALAMAKEGATIVICDINAKTFPMPSPKSRHRRALSGRAVRRLVGRERRQSVPADSRSLRHARHLVNNAALVQSGATNEEMRSKFYKMMTTPVAKESLGVTKDFPDEEWHKYWGVNVHGVFYCTREALRIMEPKKSGKIINIASIAGIGGFSAFHPAYCATKGAVLAFTRSVAIEVAGANIFVNAIAAGGILTPPMEAYLAESDGGSPQRLHQLIPLGRLGQAGGVRLARRLPRLRRALSGRPDDQPERRHDCLRRHKAGAGGDASVWRANCRSRRKVTLCESSIPGGSIDAVAVAAGVCSHRPGRRDVSGRSGIPCSSCSRFSPSFPWQPS